MKKPKEIIYDELVLLSGAFEKPQTENRIKIYTEELAEFDFNSVCLAIRELKRTSEFFPSLAKIIEKIKSPNGSSAEQAVLIADEIVSCISRYGHTNLGECRAFLGADKWAIVEAAGGWIDICKVEYDGLGILKAQLRELAKAYLERSKRDFKGGDFRINTSPVQIGKSAGLKKLEVFNA